MIQLNLPRYWIDLYHPGHLFQAAGSLARQGASLVSRDLANSRILLRILFLCLTSFERSEIFLASLIRTCVLDTFVRAARVSKNWKTCFLFWFCAIFILKTQDQTQLR